MCFDSEGSLGGVVCLRSVEVDYLSRSKSDQGERSSHNGNCEHHQVHLKAVRHHGNAQLQNLRAFLVFESKCALRTMLASAAAVGGGEFKLQSLLQLFSRSLRVS